MCGLFGFASSQSIKNIDGAMVVLALENLQRGRDSWGASDGKQLFKAIGPVDRQWFKLPIRDKGVLLAHTRQATVGAVTADNSHPWRFDGKHRVIGAHNGAIYNYKELNDEYKRKFDVDSMHIFGHLSDDRPLDELEGYGAVSFLLDDKLCLSRFNDGSLSIAQLYEGEKPIGIAWSSVQYDLKKALEGAGIKHSYYKVEDNHIYYWSEDQLFDSKHHMTIKKYIKVNSAYPSSGGHRINHSLTGIVDDGTKSTTTRDKRIIRFRVVRDLAKPDDELAEIKQRIFNHPAITRATTAGACEDCGHSCMIKLFDKDYMCLPCIAKEIKEGKLMLPPTEAANV